MLEKRKPGPLFPGFAYDDFMFVVFIKALLQASNTGGSHQKPRCFFNYFLNTSSKLTPTSSATFFKRATFSSISQ